MVRTGADQLARLNPMKIAILYNTSEYLVRFRTELMQALIEAGNEVVAITPRDRSSELLLELGVRWREWKLNATSLHPIHDLRSIRELRRILKEEKPCTVMAFTIKPVLYGSLVARWLGVPRIVSMIAGMGSMFGADEGWKRALVPLVNIGYRWAMRCNQRVLFQNDEDMNLFIDKRFIRPDQAERINGSGVNLDQFVPVERPFRKGSFLLVARMLESKGVRQFCEAAGVLKIRFPEARFLLVGPIGEGSGAISAREIADWEAQGIIEYLGEQADVRPVLASTEVFVLPTFYFEGVPRSILEALAMGKPIITTDWRGCRDTVVPGVNGFLVPPRDPVALASAMSRFLEEPALSAPFGEASRRIAEKKFDVAVVNGIVLRALGCSMSAAASGAHHDLHGD